MDLTFQVPMQYCSLQHQTLFLSPVPSTTGHCFCFGSIPSFFLDLFLHWSPLAYWAPTGRCSNQPGEFLFQYSINFPIPTVHGALKARILKWFAIPFSSGPHSQTSLPWPGRLGWPHTAWLSFIELDKAVVLWADWLVFCDCSFNVCHLMPSCNTYRLTWVSLTLDEGYLLTATPPDLEHGVMVALKKILPETCTCWLI